jgi:hypothetical protein
MLTPFARTDHHALLSGAAKKFCSINDLKVVEYFPPRGSAWL